MNVQLNSTTRIVTLVVDGHEVPARVWEGHTDSGIAVHAFVTRIVVDRAANTERFEEELLECRAPVNGDIAAYPMRIVL